MKNYIRKDTQITVKLDSPVSSGDPVQVGALTGVATGDTREDKMTTVATRGIYSFPNALGLVIGDLVKIHDGNLSKEAAHKTIFGVVTEVFTKGESSFMGVMLK